ncbi:amidohydrolase family protein [Cellulosimicrobium composti]|uniref:Amidohydrolase family protein n=1 Tax=Cellulosimicrobium composti TaxID=2672572 RepID=A0A6N7ZJT2_9MICO|nr:MULTISPECIES: amidohydrolase family protein [Cellulosimicrobium]KFD43604.1 amidohydrolase [Cellulosimicrobium sp. MM]MTG89741.1 amidohydrolase family protein [Cellulosimicrobium composti]SMF32233.1 Imidazolonepropionase [Cellulosimicrobium cellulans J1]
MSALEGPSLHVRGHVIVGDDREVGDLWVKDGRISLTRPSAQGTNMVELEGWVLPGLVDVHCHVGLGAQGAVDAATAQAQATTDRDSGVLLVRDAGSPLDTRWVHGRRDLPRLVRAGRHVARPKRYLRHYGLELDDVAQLPEAVRREARQGDGWVKIVGDWIDRDLGAEGDLRPLWPDDVLAEAVAAAHAEAARVTVHAFSEEVIPSLLAAGVDGIEHGTGIDPDLMYEISERGVAVTPTLLQIGQFETIARQADEKYPVFAARMRRLHARRYEQARALYEAGIQILVGTDAGGTIGHGRLADECAELVAAGIPDAAVVAAASWQGREYLGYTSLVEGASADFVVYPQDPREDVGVLRAPTAVVLRGEIVAPVTA